MLIFSCTLKFLPATPDSFQAVAKLEADHSSENTEVAKPLKPPNSRMCFPNIMNHIAFISSATPFSEEVYINFVWGSAFFFPQIPFLNETGRKLQVFSSPTPAIRMLMLLFLQKDEITSKARLQFENCPLELHFFLYFSAKG